MNLVACNEDCKISRVFPGVAVMLCQQHWQAVEQELLQGRCAQLEVWATKETINFGVCYIDIDKIDGFNTVGIFYRLSLP